MRIGIIGNLANVGYSLAKFMNTTGEKTQLLVHELDVEALVKMNPGMTPGNDTNLLILKDNKHGKLFREMAAVRKFDLIISVCLGGRLHLPFFGKKYVSYATGSDLRELAAGIGHSRLETALARRTFKRASLVFISPDPGHLAMVTELRLQLTVPWRQFVDTNFWQAPIKKKSDAKILKIFHPAALHWVQTFPGQWTKGNDILFRGFKIFLEKGGVGRLYFLKRGADLAATVELIDELGLQDCVEGVGGDLDRNQLKEMMTPMDVVADQFIIGCIGLIALEAMALGKPTLVYYDKKMMDWAYPYPEEGPPVLNAQTPMEVANQLLAQQSPEVLYTNGCAARAWIENYHDPRKLAQWYLKHLKTALTFA